MSILLPVKVLRSFISSKDLGLGFVNNYTMTSVNPVEDLRAEQLIERTPKGWPLTPLALQYISESVSMDEEHVAHVGQCRNCGILLNQKFYFAGCPNCKAQDVDML
jgi:hypothetical protein